MLWTVTIHHSTVNQLWVPCVLVKKALLKKQRFLKKGGVDIVNLLSAHNTQKIKSNCWAKNALIFILNTVYTNAKTIFSKSASKKSLSSLEFTNQSREILIKKC